MSRSICISLVFVVVGASIFVSLDSKRPVGANTSSIVPVELLKSRLDAARNVFQSNLQKLQNGEATTNEGALSWSEQLVNAELAMSNKRPDRVAALKAHLERAKELEKIATTYVKAGQGRELDVQGAIYFRIDAEIRLLQATSE